MTGRLDAYLRGQARTEAALDRAILEMIIENTLRLPDLSSPEAIDVRQRLLEDIRRCLYGALRYEWPADEAESS